MLHQHSHHVSQAQNLVLIQNGRDDDGEQRMESSRLIDVKQFEVMKRSSQEYYCVKKLTQGNLSKTASPETMREEVNLASPLAPQLNGKLLHEDMIKLINSAEDTGN